jgi:membrane-bound lytic murein transglycosylase F
MAKIYFVIYLIYRSITQEPDIMTSEFDHIIKAATAQHLPGYDWRLYKAQLWQESRLQPDAISHVGAEGIAQFMPETWKQYAPLAGYPDSPPTDPTASIYTGAYYLAWLINEWAWERPDIDRHCLALASYNSGIGHILEAQKEAGYPSLYAEIIEKLPQVTGDHSTETINYVENILTYCSRMVTGADR